jgi:cysteinyl-tRNA synthetase
MDDDLNTSGALAAIFDLVAEINRRADTVLKGAASAYVEARGLVAARAVLQEFLGVLGLRVGASAGEEEVGPRVRELAAALRSEAAHLFAADPPDALEDVVAFILSGREQARRLKDFKTADAIRSRLSEAGILVEDLPTGPRWRVAVPDGPAPD